MESVELFSFFETLSWAGAFGVLFWYAGRIGVRWTNHFVKTFQNGDGYKIQEVANHCELLETNHIEHLKDDLERIKQEQQAVREFRKEVRDKLAQIETDIAVIKVRIEK